MVTDCELAGLFGALAANVHDEASWGALADVMADRDSHEGWLARMRAGDVACRASALIELAGWAAPTDYGRCQVEYVQTFSGYSEPGYADPECGLVAVGNWNSVRPYREEGPEDFTPELLGEALDALGVPCEWSDEWTSCDGCNKIVRTQPDGFSWTPAYSYDDDNEVDCHGCREPETNSQDD
jgi:hypothetical protein